MSGSYPSNLAWIKPATNEFLAESAVSLCILGWNGPAIILSLKNLTELLKMLVGGKNDDTSSKAKNKPKASKKPHSPQKEVALSTAQAFVILLFVFGIFFVSAFFSPIIGKSFLFQGQVDTDRS